MPDGVVQVPPDSTGKNIETEELTRPDALVVERQVVTLGDSQDQRRKIQIARGESGGELTVQDPTGQDLLKQILDTLIEIRALLLESVQ
jgi:hypothetical protein